MRVEGIVKVEMPEYRGAPYPKFNERAINESKFADELRIKSFWTDLEDGILTVTWIAQETFSHYQFLGMIQEFERYFKVVRPEGIHKVIVKGYCRSTYPELLDDKEFELN